jgi:hypothetical protein
VKRVYVHVDPELLADPEGRPICVWFTETGVVRRVSSVIFEGPSKIVHDPEGIVDPEGRGVRVWIETDAGLLAIEGWEFV